MTNIRHYDKPCAIVCELRKVVAVMNTDLVIIIRYINNLIYF